ncbi:cytochrome c oxidase subunit 3 [Methylobacterium organophilum]|uniref:Cytochrome c oxidase subunit 3 n=1 Tax=Methylobacterium organophilum TaxID=410 RepID=A0ABQ4T6R4_METOR|nr:cytochrome c oxidase subunit 3 [Methylobacterium organophilum]GJE26654.1 Cytochrome c oxidase subunit 3 [Methylobacterium organophilum]
MSAGADKLLREPWDELALPEAQALARQRAGAAFGIWVFLASEVLFFGALFLLYAALRLEHSQAFLAAARETNLVYGTINTVLLLTSGLGAAVAAQAAEDGRLRRMTLWCLAATLALGLAFLVVKGLEYREDIERHLVPGARFALPEGPAQLFFGFYWLSTVLHAIHLSIGLGLLARLLWKGAREPDFLVGNPQVEVATLYWGFVDLVWIFLYPVLYLAGRAG